MFLGTGSFYPVLCDVGNEVCEPTFNFFNFNFSRNYSGYKGLTSKTGEELRVVQLKLLVTKEKENLSFED